MFKSVRIKVEAGGLDFKLYANDLLIKSYKIYRLSLGLFSTPTVFYHSNGIGFMQGFIKSFKRDSLSHYVASSIPLQVVP